MNSQKSPEWSLHTKRTVALIGFLFFVAMVWFIRGILPIVIVSVLIAFILNPIVTVLTRRVLIAPNNDGARRGIAALITFLMAVITIIILFLVIIPDLVDEIASFGRQIPTFVQQFETEIETFLEQPITFGDETFQIEGEPFIPLDRIEEITGSRDISALLLLDQIDLTAAAETFIGSARNLSGPAFSFVGGAFNTLINMIFLVMMTFYLLKDGGNFIKMTIKIAPEAYQADATRLFEELGHVWNAYLRGQLILSFVMGSSVYIAATLLGLPNAAILGLLAGVLEFIPNLGPLIALIPAALLALISQSTTIPALSGVSFMFTVIFVWTMLQNIEAVVLVPRIMGDSLDLHPFIVILAVLGGAALGGALGIILAAPFVASGRVITYYVYGKLTDTEPFRELEDKRIKARETLFSKLLVRIWQWLLALTTRQQQKTITDAD
ncbi:MAG: AI-2E family transporter [Phototrophicaceae bacterium]